MASKLPEQFIERLKQIIPEEKFDSVLATFSTRKPSTFRVNTLKTTSEKLIADLQKEGFEVTDTEIPDAYILASKTQRELTETDIYKNGELYIQGLSSMIPPLLLNPHQ